MRRPPGVSAILRAGRIIGLALATACATDTAITVGPTPPTNPRGAVDVAMTVDTRSSTPISPWIYGINQYESAPGEDTPTWPSKLRMSRFGGNRLTAYNWENNASNAGSDWDYHNDGYLGGGDVPGEAVRSRIAAAAARGAGMLVTVPMIGHVAKDKLGTSVGIDPATLETRLATRFVESVARKRMPFTASPDTTDRFVYQDEFVAWLQASFPGRLSARGPTPIFVSLDNEPDSWPWTHEEILSRVDGKPRILAYEPFINTTIAYAAATKDVAPDALVFGPAIATWTGAATLGRWPEPDPVFGTRFFLDVYLEKLREAERVAGRRLVDVLDLHWYPAAGTTAYEITNDYAPDLPELAQARLQAPRSLWDPGYDERSWVSDVQGGPIRLLPLLREKIAAHYPGTKIAITEYYYGRGGDISGGIAQADVLGIFGREGVFAAMLWPEAGLWAPPYGGDPEKAYAYVIGAFRAFRDYDGNGHAFGDHALAATNSDWATASIYASRDATDPSRLVLVVINKAQTGVRASIAVSADLTFDKAEAYVMSDGVPQPTRRADLSSAGRNTFIYTMPPLSVTTLVLRP